MSRGAQLPRPGLHDDTARRDAVLSWRGPSAVSLTVCLAPANTVAYPNGGRHLWMYFNWALDKAAKRAAGGRPLLEEAAIR
jgi:hypothetical protein